MQVLIGLFVSAQTHAGHTPGVKRGVIIGMRGQLNIGIRLCFLGAHFGGAEPLDM
jgi:hypothetical protein